MHHGAKGRAEGGWKLGTAEPARNARTGEREGGAQNAEMEKALDTMKEFVVEGEVGSDVGIMRACMVG